MVEIDKSEARKASNIEELCCGNRDAIQFCVVFYKWCHWIDDLIDRDKKWDPDAAIRINLNALVVFSENKFFQRHSSALLALILQAARAQGDSVEWMSRSYSDGAPNKQDRRAAEVLKSGYHEVVWHAAYLAAVEAGMDGWKHLTAMTQRHRAFDYDYKE